MSIDDRHIIWEYEVQPLDDGAGASHAPRQEHLAEPGCMVRSEGWEMVAPLMVETRGTTTQVLALFRRLAR